MLPVVLSETSAEILGLDARNQREALGSVAGLVELNDGVSISRRTHGLVCHDSLDPTGDKQQVNRETHLEEDLEEHTDRC